MQYSTLLLQFSSISRLDSHQLTLTHQIKIKLRLKRLCPSSTNHHLAPCTLCYFWTWFDYEMIELVLHYHEKYTSTPLHWPLTADWNRRNEGRNVVCVVCRSIPYACSRPYLPKSLSLTLPYKTSRRGEHAEQRAAARKTGKIH